MASIKPKILYVEDDETLGFIIKENLEKKGYDIVHCLDGETAFDKFRTIGFNLIILDVMLPRIDGFSLAEKIREKNEEVPVLFVTAKSMLEDKLHGLMLGGDDYIIKPFSIEELLLKVDIFLKRSAIYSDVSYPVQISFNEFILNLEDLTLQHKVRTYKLTQREAELLQLFVSNEGKLLSRQAILQKIWGDDDYFAGRSLDVFISRLRKYLKQDHTIRIENKHGIGFTFKIEKSKKGV